MPNPFNLHLPRPASVVIRFTNQDRFNTAIDLYKKFLEMEPSSQQRDVFASFQVGSAQKPTERDIEFRLELHPGDPTKLKGHTLLYWGIDEKRTAEYKQLANKANYKEEVLDGEQLAAGQFLLTDRFDNFFGGHPNPPFPPGVPGAGPGPAPGDGQKGFLSLPGFVTGLLSGIVLGGLLLGGAQVLRSR